MSNYGYVKPLPEAHHATECLGCLGDSWCCANWWHVPKTENAPSHTFKLLLLTRWFQTSNGDKSKADACEGHCPCCGDPGKLHVDGDKMNCDRCMLFWAIEPRAEVSALVITIICPDFWPGTCDSAWHIVEVNL